MRGLATVAAGWLLGAAGCATELVGVSVEPPAVEVASPPARFAAEVACEVEDAFATQSWWRQEHGYLPRRRDDLVAALSGSEVFRAAVPEGADRAAEAPCLARLQITSVSEPEIHTDARTGLVVVSAVVVGIPLLFVWTDREPDLVDRFVLEVGVRGEAPAGRYEVEVRGTVRAQTPDRNQAREAMEEHRATLRGEALRALVSRFRGDAAAHDRLRAQLDEDLPADLAPFLVSEETHAPRARWRTRRLIAWTQAGLGAWVAEARTADLREHVARLQVCVVDLSHAAEVQRDEAEALVAKGAEAVTRHDEHGRTVTRSG